MKNFGVFLMSALGMCSVASAANNVAGFEPMFDPGLSTERSDMLMSDISRLNKLEISVAPTSYFAKAFNGKGTSEVVTYLNKRIHFLIPEDADIEKRLKVLKSDSAPAAQIAEEGKKEEKKKAYVMASNVGILVWRLQQMSRPEKLFFQFGDKHIPLEKVSSRVGIVQLGEGYSDKFPGIIRTETLVHEARHSDCTGGLASDAVEEMKKGNFSVQRQCGHLHVKCPEGHSLAGNFACDGHPWGAYAIGSIYAAAIAKTCANCSEKDKQYAAASAVDSFSRVLIAKDMAAGKFGDPDMSSDGVRN